MLGVVILRPGDWLPIRCLWITAQAGRGGLIRSYAGTSFLVTPGKVMLCASVSPLQNSSVHIVVELYLFISADFMGVGN